MGFRQNTYWTLHTDITLYIEPYWATQTGTIFFVFTEPALLLNAASCFLMDMQRASQVATPKPGFPARLSRHDH